jgi:hypothetical protein
MTLRHRSVAPGSGWRTSSRSAAAGHCVQVALGPESVVVRDSKDATGPVLRFTGRGWTGFLAGVRSGEFDRPAR